MLVEQFDEFCEIGKRTGPTIDLVDHNDVDAALANFFYELAQRWALDRSARKASVVVAVADQSLPSVGLALDVGLGGLALVDERVELLLRRLEARSRPLPNKGALELG